jgi:hypothetical protein
MVILVYIQAKHCHLDRKIFLEFYLVKRKYISPFSVFLFQEFLNILYRWVMSMTPGSVLACCRRPGYLRVVCTHMRYLQVRRSRQTCPGTSFLSQVIRILLFCINSAVSCISIHVLFQCVACIKASIYFTISNLFICKYHLSHQSIFTQLTITNSLLH